MPSRPPSIHLGNDVPSTVTVAALAPDRPSEGILKAGDVILTVDGDPVKDVTELRAAIAGTGVGKPADARHPARHEARDVTVVPELAAERSRPVIGIRRRWTTSSRST